MSHERDLIRADLRHDTRSAGPQTKVFFLGCVIIAGLYGAKTVSSRILFIQAAPAALALAAVLLSRSV